MNSPVAKFFDEAAFTALLWTTWVPARATHRILRRGRVQHRQRLHGLGAPEGPARISTWSRPAGSLYRCCSMFEWDAEAQRHVALHHPFTRPAVDDVDDLRANARTATSRGYDMVLNGNEIGGGSIRIHRPQMRSAVFELLGIGAEGRSEVRLPAGRAPLARRPRRHRGSLDRITPRWRARNRSATSSPSTQDHHRAVPDDRRAVTDRRRAAAGRAACRRAPEGRVICLWERL